MSRRQHNLLCPSKEKRAEQLLMKATRRGADLNTVRATVAHTRYETVHLLFHSLFQSAADLIIFSDCFFFLSVVYLKRLIAHSTSIRVSIDYYPCKCSLNGASGAVPDEGRWERSSRSGGHGLGPSGVGITPSRLIKAAGSGDAQLSFIVRYAQMIRPAVECHIFLNKPCRNWTLTPCTYGLQGSQSHSCTCTLMCANIRHTCTHTRTRKSQCVGLHKSLDYTALCFWIMYTSCLNHIWGNEC